jgi:hypothetical protein
VVPCTTICTATKIACTGLKTFVTSGSLCLDMLSYIGMLISLWLFLFAAQPKEFFLDGLKRLEQ